MLIFSQRYRHESYPRMKGYNFEYVTGRGSKRIRKGQPCKNWPVSGFSETSALFLVAYFWRTAQTGSMLGSAHAGLVLCGCVNELVGRPQCLGPKPATTPNLVLVKAGHPPRLNSCRGQSERCQPVWHWNCKFLDFFFFSGMWITACKISLFGDRWWCQSCFCEATTVLHTESLGQGSTQAGLSAVTQLINSIDHPCCDGINGYG